MTNSLELTKVVSSLSACSMQVLQFYADRIFNKTGLQPVSRPMELVHYFGGWVEGASKQTDMTDGGWVQSTFGAKTVQIKLGALRAAKHL